MKMVIACISRSIQA